MNIMGFKKIQVFFILFLLSLVVYSSSLKGPFLFDDNKLIVANQDVRGYENIRSIFSREVFHVSDTQRGKRFQYYRPLQILSFLVDYSVWKLNPLGYHLTNVFLHSLVGFLVFYLIFRLFTNYPLALLTAILFSVHPIQSETVSFISGRSELLVALCTLLSIVMYLQYIRVNRMRWFFILASLISFICALLSREAGFLLLVPFFIVFLGFRYKERIGSILLHFISFFGVLAIYAFLRLTFLVKIEITPTSGYSFLGDILNFISVIFEYLWLLIFPFGLHILRVIQPLYSANQPYLYVYILLAFLVCALNMRFLKEKKYVVLFGTIWFVAGLAYLIKFMYKFDRFVLAAEEHWVYLPSMGFFLILSYFIIGLKRDRLKKIAITLFVLLYGFLTFRHNFIWRQRDIFYEYNMGYSKLDGLLSENYIAELLAQGSYKKAIQQTEAAMRLYGRDAFYYLYLGEAHKGLNQYPEAKKYYRQALEVNPLYSLAHNRLKVLTEETGEVYRLEDDPYFSESENQIISLLKMGQFHQAFERLDEEILLQPDQVNLYIILGVAYGQMGKYLVAEKAFKYALELDPENIMTLHNLSIAYRKLDRYDKYEELKEKIKMVNQSERGGQG